MFIECCRIFVIFVHEVDCTGKLQDGTSFLCHAALLAPSDFGVDYPFRRTTPSILLDGGRRVGRCEQYF